MTFHKTLKLTALGLGITSIALTGCKGKDGNNGVDAKGAKTTLPTEPAKVTTKDGVDLAYFLASFDGTFKDKDGNILKGNYKIGRHTEPEIKILGPGLPSNSCVRFQIIVKDVNNKEIILSNAAAFYDAEGRVIDKKVHYKLDAESQQIASIQGNKICVLTKEELNKLHSVDNNNKDNADNGEFRDMNMFQASLATRSVKLIVEGLFEKTVDQVIPILNPEITKAYINDGKQHYVPIPAGAMSGGFAINGERAKRDITTKDERTAKNFQDYQPLDKINLEYIKLFETHLGKEIDDALVFDEGSSQWQIDSSKISNDYNSNKKLLGFNEHVIKIKYKDQVNELSVPVYIKIERAVPVEYKVNQINTHVFGQQGFDVELRYSNSKNFVNIAELPESELKNINLTFTLNKNTNKESASDIKIISTISDKVKVNFGAKEIKDQNHLTKFDKNKHAFMIDASAAKSFQEENNRYELKLKLEYTRDSKKMSITDAEYKNLSPNDRFNYTCGNKSVLTEDDYNKAKSNLTSYNTYIAEKKSYDNDKKKITKADNSEYSTYAEYLIGKNGISDAEFERISSAGTAEEKKKINNSESTPYANYAEYLLGKNLINKTKFDTIRASQKPTEVTKTSSEDLANLGKDYNAYKSNMSSDKYNSECTIDPSKISIVAIDKTIKGTNENGEIIRHFVISPFALVLVTKPLFYNITSGKYDLPQLENGTDKWTPDLFVGAQSTDADIRFRYGCVKFVSELKFFKHTKENGNIVKMLDSAKAEETISINSFNAANIADGSDNFRIDPKIVGATHSSSDGSLRQKNIFCPTNTETVGSKEFTAEFQELKSNKIALNVIDAKMPILKMLFENGQTNYTFANSTSVSILPFYQYSSGKYVKAGLAYTDIHGKFTYAHSNNTSYYHLFDSNNSMAAQSTDTFRVLSLNRPEKSAYLKQSTGVNVKASTGSSNIVFEESKFKTEFAHIAKYESYFSAVPNSKTVILNGTELSALSNDYGANEHYHNFDSSINRDAAPSSNP